MGGSVDEARPGDGHGGLLWLPFAPLRAVVRGLPLADVLAVGGVEFAPAPDPAPPADALIYLPNEYGERYLLRVVAKYGLRAISGGGE